MSSATFYKRRAKYGVMDASRITRMKELEEENRRLKKRCAEERFKAKISQEALAKNREAIFLPVDGQEVRHGVSIRLACQAFVISKTQPKLARECPDRTLQPDGAQRLAGAVSVLKASASAGICHPLALDV